MTPRLRTVGLAGRIAQTFLHSKLTPLTIFASILLGLLATLTLPREEEPQIKVPMVDVQIAWPGAPVGQVERQLTTPVERGLWQIPDLEYLYSISREDGAAIILRFKVGFDERPIDHELCCIVGELEAAGFELVRWFTDPAGDFALSLSRRR